MTATKIKPPADLSDDQLHAELAARQARRDAVVAAESHARSAAFERLAREANEERADEYMAAYDQANAKLDEIATAPGELDTSGLQRQFLEVKRVGAEAGALFWVAMRHIETLPMQHNHIGVEVGRGRPRIPEGMFEAIRWADYLEQVIAARYEQHRRQHQAQLFADIDRHVDAAGDAARAAAEAEHE